MFGRDRTHNAVSPEKGAPTDWQIEVRAEQGQAAKAARNIKWVAKLGGPSLGGPVVANGLVWVGTNNAHPRDPTSAKDASVLMCLRESDGKFLWQYISPRLSMYDGDGPMHSMGCTPLIEGDLLWLFTNRCELLCLDFGPLHRGEGPPKERWKKDIRKEFGVHSRAPLMAAGFSPSPAADRERVFAVTGNGVDDGGINLPAPQAPSLICFNKKTGQTLWKDASPGKDILSAQRSSPLVIEIGGQIQVVVGQGDGWLRSFDAATGKLIWKCDLNPKGAKYAPGGGGRKNYAMATPVFYDGRIYIAPGQDPELGPGDNELFCVDPKGAGDVSAELDDGQGKGKQNPNSRVVWRYGGLGGEGDMRRHLFGRTMANCTIHEGLVYTCDFAGFAYCFDAKSGRLYWWHDLKAEVWSAPLWADDKLYFATGDGDIWIFAKGKDKKLLKTIEMEERIWVTPIYLNGTLYVMTNSTLYAINGQK
jgi:outer membrane protein assembly factor BamB